MDSFFECHNCGYMIVNFTVDDYLDDFGSLCYCQVEAHQEEDSNLEDSVGDITEGMNGLNILTPHGWWELTDEEALMLNSGLGQMLRYRLTRPWSDDDQSTIITRGRRTYVEEGK